MANDKLHRFLVPEPDLGDFDFVHAEKPLT